MTHKEFLANEYVRLRKEFDGVDFKLGLKDFNIDFLTKEFKVWQLKDKIEAVKNAINERNKCLLIKDI